MLGTLIHLIDGKIFLSSIQLLLHLHTISRLYWIFLHSLVPFWCSHTTRSSLDDTLYIRFYRVLLVYFYLVIVNRCVSSNHWSLFYNSHTQPLSSVIPHTTLHSSSYFDLYHSSIKSFKQISSLFCLFPIINSPLLKT